MTAYYSDTGAFKTYYSDTTALISYFSNATALTTLVSFSVSLFLYLTKDDSTYASSCVLEYLSNEWLVSNMLYSLQ